MTTKTKRRTAVEDMTREELEVHAARLESDLEHARGSAEHWEDEAGSAQEEVAELNNVIAQMIDVEDADVLIGIRDEMRAGKHGLALSRLTAWLDERIECWRTRQPVAAISGAPGLPLEDAA